MSQINKVTSRIKTPAAGAKSNDENMTNKVSRIKNTWILRLMFIIAILQSASDFVRFAYVPCQTK